MGNNFNPPFRKNPYKVRNVSKDEPSPQTAKTPPIDFKTDRLCPSCGKIIKINHNFCKFCGADLSSIEPLGNSDRTLIELAKTALQDRDADVRKDAVDTIGDLGELEVLGILTYILLNDVDALVRKEAAEELGNIHHPISLDILTQTLKDRSPIVRKQAIEALKKLKKMNKAQAKSEESVELKSTSEPEIRQEFESDEEEFGSDEEEFGSNEEEFGSNEEEFESDEEEFDEEPLKQIDPQNDESYKL